MGAAVVATMTTGDDGAYWFGDLAPGEYRVEFEAPSGMAFTVRNVGSDFMDSDAAPWNGRSPKFELVGGETDLSIDAGLVAGTG
jgi:hypothetical protein